MKIITDSLEIKQLKELAQNFFGDMIKAVVDIERKVVAVDAELHADLESLLLEDGSVQKNLWGINFYPDLEGDDFVEFDSMINLRPSQGNTSRGVDNEEIRKKIIQVVDQRIQR